MTSSVLKMIQDLKDLGYNIEYRKRSDGGYIITKINGVKYTAAAGNKVARQITNTALSEAKTRQLKKITPKTKRAAKTRKKGYKKEAVDVDIEKLLRKAQRAWRKSARFNKESSPTMANVRWNIKNLGREETIKKLENIIRYSKGYAYEENIEWLKVRIKTALGEKLAAPINSKIDTMKQRFKDEWIETINYITYDKTITKKEKARRIYSFLMNH